MNPRTTWLTVGLALTLGLTAPAAPVQAEEVVCVQALHPWLSQALVPVLSIGALDKASMSGQPDEVIAELGLQSHDGFVIHAGTYFEFAFYDYQGESDGWYSYSITGLVGCNPSRFVSNAAQETQNCLQSPGLPCDLFWEIVDWVLCRAQQPQHPMCPYPPWEDWAT